MLKFPQKYLHIGIHLLKINIKWMFVRHPTWNQLHLALFAHAEPLAYEANLPQFVALVFIPRTTTQPMFGHWLTQRCRKLHPHILVNCHVSLAHSLANPVLASLASMLERRRGKWTLFAVSEMGFVSESDTHTAGYGAQGEAGPHVDIKMVKLAVDRRVCRLPVHRCQNTALEHRLNMRKLFGRFSE